MSGPLHVRINGFKINLILIIPPWGSEFSSYKIKLRNRVKQTDVTLRVTNSKVQLLFFDFRVTKSKLKNKKLRFELLTRSQKIKSFTSSYWLKD